MTDVESAEMIKYASNAFLAVKIGFINEIANLCERVGADVHVVAKGMGLDKRIGSKFLHPGPGLRRLVLPQGHARAGRAGHSARRAAAHRRGRDRGEPRCSGSCWSRRSRRRWASIAGRRIAVLGLAFKPNTDDVRESPALYVCRELALAGAEVRAFDPVAAAAAARRAGATCAIGSRSAATPTTRCARRRRAGHHDRVERVPRSRPRARAGDHEAPAARRRAQRPRSGADAALGFDYLCTGRQVAGAAGSAGVTAGLRSRAGAGHGGCSRPTCRRASPTPTCAPTRAPPATTSAPGRT